MSNLLMQVHAHNHTRTHEETYIEVPEVVAHNTVNAPVHRLVIAGNSVQNGIPDPSNPIPVNSLESFDLNMQGNNSGVSVHVPYALHKVSNLRDKLIVNGKSKTVTLCKKTGIKSFDGTEPWSLTLSRNGMSRYWTPLLGAGGTGNTLDSTVNCICTHFKGQAFSLDFKEFKVLGAATWIDRIDLSLNYTKVMPTESALEFKKYLLGLNAVGNPVTVQYILNEPTTEDITDTETGQQLLQLCTYYPDTHISIDSPNDTPGSFAECSVKVLGIAHNHPVAM